MCGFTGNNSVMRYSTSPFILFSALASLICITTLYSSWQQPVSPKLEPGVDNHSPTRSKLDPSLLPSRSHSFRHFSTLKQKLRFRQAQRSPRLPKVARPGSPSVPNTPSTPSVLNGLPLDASPPPMQGGITMKKFKPKVDLFSKDGSTVSYFENVCYDVQEKKLAYHFDGNFFHHWGRIKHVPIGSPEDRDKTGRRKTVKWMGDLTIVPQVGLLHDKGAHFWQAVWPLTHFLHIVREFFQEKHVVIYADKIALTRESYEGRLWQFLFQGLKIGQVYPPELNPTDISEPRNNTVDFKAPTVSIFSKEIPITVDYVCFRRLLFYGYGWKNRIGSYDESFQFRQRVANIVPDYKPYYHCRDNGRKVLHLLQRRVTTRKIVNIDAVQKALSSIAKVDLEDVIIFDSPSTGDVIRDINTFRNVTFMLSVHGANNMNIIFLPKESHIVEVFPPFFTTERMYQMLSGTLEMRYFSFLEKNSSILDKEHPDQIGRHIQKNAKRYAVHFTLEGPNSLIPLLETAISSWENTCVKR